MSLMNDMLRDLDRQGRAAASASETETLLAASSLGRRVARPNWLPTLLVFALVVSVVWWQPWSTAADSSAAVAQSSPVVEPVEVESAAFESASEPEPNALAAVGAGASPSVSQPASDPDAVQTQPQIRELAQAPVAPVSVAQVPVIQEPVAQTHQHPAADPTGSVPAHTPVAVSAPEETHMQVVRSPEWLDRRTAEQAQVLLAEGRTREARAQLQAFLTDHPQASISAEVLLRSYLQAGELAQLEQLLTAYPQLSLSLRIRTQAQLLLARGQGEAALSLLEEHQQQVLADAPADEDYRALLAAVYQHQGAYPHSAAYYQQLLGDFGERPVYWLGLALALDSQGQGANALAAYRRARVGQQPAVRDYIDQRIAALAR